MSLNGKCSPRCQQKKPGFFVGCSSAVRPPWTTSRPTASSMSMCDPHCLPMQLGGDLRDLSALIARAGELVRGRHTRAVGTGNRRGAIRRATRNLVKGHLTRMAVIETDDQHAEVQ